MLRPALVAVVLTLAAVLMVGSGQRNFAMPADAQRPDNLESVAVGRKVAERVCSACHAVGKTGESPNPRSPRFPLIAERYPDANPAGVLTDGTVVRHPGMPEFHMLEFETDGLVAYLRYISRTYRPSNR